MDVYEVQQGEGAADDERVVQTFVEEFMSAKAFLQKSSTETGENLYDHLTEVLNKILAERPENVIDFFEEYSRKVKERRFKPLTDHLEDVYIPPGQYETARKLMELLKGPAAAGDAAMDPEDLELADMSKNNTLQLLHFFEQAGVGLPRMEMFAIMLSMNRLIRKEPIASVRFWGKVYGVVKNYLVVEAELIDEEYMKRNEAANKGEIPVADEKPVAEGPEELNKDLQENLEDIAKEQEIGGEGYQVVKRALPPEPQNLFEPPPEPPVELSGVGVNKKVASHQSTLQK